MKAKLRRMLRRLISLSGFRFGVAAALVLCAVPLLAAPVVRIRQQQCDQSGQCSSAFWSGAVIEWDGTKKRHFVLSCAHGYQRQQPVSVEVTQDRWVSGSFIAVDPKLDLSLIAVPWAEKPVTMYPIADVPAQTGAEIGVCGYPRGQPQIRCRSTHVKRRISDRLDSVEATFIPGESGGSATIDGRLVGVVVYSDYVVRGSIEIFPPVAVDINPDGYIVNWETVSTFTRPHLDGIPRTYSRSTDRQQAAIGQDQQPPSYERPSVPPPTPLPLPTQPAAGSGASIADPPRPPIPDFTLLKVLLVKKDDRGSAAGWKELVIDVSERLTGEEVGLVDAARRYVSTKTESKADVDIVLGRVHPEQSKALLSLLDAGTEYGAIVLVRRGFTGAPGFLEDLGSGLVKRFGRFSTGRGEFVVVREGDDDYTEAIDALELNDQTEPTNPLTRTILTVIATLLAWLGIGRARNGMKPPAPTPAPPPVTEVASNGT